MGTIIDPIAIRAQSDSVVRALSAQNQTLKQVLPVINNFEGESELTGAAWSGLKSHMGGHKSVIRGLICANEDVMNDSEELVSICGDEKLDEDEIQVEIEVLKGQNDRYRSIIVNYTKLLTKPLMPLMPTLPPFYNEMTKYYTSLISGNEKLIVQLEMKLAKISKIVSATSSLFVNSETLYLNVEMGMQQLGASGSGSGFSGVTGGTWQSNLNKRWTTREEVNAERFLRSEGITTGQITNMQKNGYKTTELSSEYRSLETKQDKEFYKLLISGKKENFVDAFRTSPDLLSDNLFGALLNYIQKLIFVEKSEKSGNVSNLLNGLLAQHDEMPQEATAEDSQTTTFPNGRIEKYLFRVLEQTSSSVN